MDGDALCSSQDQQRRPKGPRPYDVIDVLSNSFRTLEKKTDYSSALVWWINDARSINYL